MIAVEEKFFLPILQTLPKSKFWSKIELLKQLQHEFRDLREHQLNDFNQAWNLLLEADIVAENIGVLSLTKKGRHVVRLNYATFTMKHYQFHLEHGAEYMIRFSGDNSAQTKNFFENLFTNNLENLVIALIFGFIVMSLSIFMGKGVMKTAFEPGINKLEQELEQNLNQQLDQVDQAVKKH